MLLATLLAGAALVALGLGDGPPTPFVQRVPGTAATLRMVPIPTAVVADGTGAERTVGGYWMAATEVTWDLYDAFVLEDPASAPGVDAVARPSRPYLTADRGFGREGFPVLSVSFAGATAFCDWLSAHTGRTWRLPDEVEWQHAALAGSRGPWHTAEGFDGVQAETIARVAWCAPHANGRTRPVGTLLPNAFGLFDMHGNVAEWVTSADGKGRLAGGSYRDAASATAATARQRPDARWNASDPNLPKSRWWLADAPFAGFRVLCESAPEAPGDDEER